MKKFLFMFLAAVAAPLFAAVHENVLFYKDQGSWKSSISPIPAGQPNAGRIAWDGKKPLRFRKADGKTFDLKKAGFISWMMYQKPGQTFARLIIVFVYSDGTHSSIKINTNRRPGWNRHAPYIAQMQKIPCKPVKEVRLQFGKVKVPVLIDDVRFTPAKLDHSYPDDLLPQPEKGCFFPEFTTPEVRAKVLNAPDFKARMAEIEKLRRGPLFQLPLRKVRDRKGQNLFDMIRDDGSVSGYTYEEIMVRHDKERRVGTRHESFGRDMVVFYEKILNAWIYGHCDRNRANKEKFFKSVIHGFSAECNRRGERERFVVASFLYPQIAIKIYRAFLKDMEDVENGINKDPLAVKVNRILKECASWCYSQPDWAVSGDFLTVDSFRHANPWGGGNFGYRPLIKAALVCRNPGMLEVVADVAKGALSYTSYNTRSTAFWIDGLCADGSAWGHGEQNYLFGYPLSGVKSVVQIINELKGTSWEISCEGSAFDALLRYLESSVWYGFSYSPLKKYPDKKMLQCDLPVACGRVGLKWNKLGAYKGFDSMTALISLIRPLLKKGTSQYQRLENIYSVMTGNAALLPIGTRYFWNNDLLICRQKSSAAVISMLSKRVRSMESAPSSSFFTDFWTDGSAWIMTTPVTYRIARGFFDPCAIPGVTARQWEFTHKSKYWRNYRGLRNFAGGAANGDYGVCAYHMDRQKILSRSPDPKFYDLEARKAYFWFNGELVCTGNTITDRKKLNTQVCTTIDQTEWSGPVCFGDKLIRPGEKFAGKGKLLWHNGTGYAVLQGNAFFSGEIRNERWLKFDSSNAKRPSRPKKAAILQMQIDHGKNPQNDSYIYAVNFNMKDFSSLQKYAEKPSFKVLANNKNIQAVKHLSSKTTGAVFYRAGKIGGLSADAPAVVLIREVNGKTQITVNDPEQDPERRSINITWQGKKYTITLPDGVNCGKPVTVTK